MIEFAVDKDPTVRGLETKSNIAASLVLLVYGMVTLLQTFNNFKDIGLKWEFCFYTTIHSFRFVFMGISAAIFFT